MGGWLGAGWRRVVFALESKKCAPDQPTAGLDRTPSLGDKSRKLTSIFYSIKTENMRSLELLARMGTKGNNINGSVGGRAHSALTDSDVAGALAGVRHPIGSKLLRVKYNLEPVGVLRDEWRALVFKEAAALEWGARKKATFERLADGVLKEAILRNVDDVGSLSQRMRSDMLGMSLKSYQELWHARFEHCLAILSLIERDACDQYARHMKSR